MVNNGKRKGWSYVTIMRSAAETSEYFRTAREVYNALFDRARVEGWSFPEGLPDQLYWNMPAPEFRSSIYAIPAIVVWRGSLNDTVDLYRRWLFDNYIGNYIEPPVLTSRLSTERLGLVHPERYVSGQFSARWVIVNAAGLIDPLNGISPVSARKYDHIAGIEGLAALAQHPNWPPAMDMLSEGAPVLPVSLSEIVVDPNISPPHGRQVLTASWNTAAGSLQVRSQVADRPYQMHAHLLYQDWVSPGK